MVGPAAEVEDRMLGDFRTEDERADAPRSHRRKDSGKSVIAMTLVVALFGVIGVGGWWAYNNVIKDYFVAEDYAGDGNGNQVVITVEEGWFVSDIADELEAEGVVASAKAFLNASEDANNAGQSIQPGSYAMEEEMSAAAALEFMTDPANLTLDHVVVPEGKRSFEIYEILAEYTGVPIEDFEAAAQDPEALGVDPIWFEGFSDRQVKSVEGFLFPSAYEFDETMTAEQMLSEMVKRFNETIEEIGFLDKLADIQDPDPEYDPGAMENQTFYPPTNGEFKIQPWMALQIASIVQSESGIASDDPKIAQVMYNKMYLNPYSHEQTNCNCFESEAIWNYGRLLNGEEAITSGEEIDWGAVMRDPDNPWSPSAPEHAGYLPSAISNPGAAALESAVAPEANDYLFFVTAFDDGRALFAETYAEHNDNIDIAEENGIQ
ncbi:endolytic transglycosylase MltG [Glycomyces tritici]|uniref:Endolytic murein transglycosylase n=1 Tax=Glycomyces tritici TaxID=2665176 RepID=A0ABT7YL29_9ACTN|nr:endolytic transglycosylase MltG [Glycomyces tritici]MDN3239324.1 endolytic transglycosylase MltG [Glycomyces tritici]